MPKAETTDAGSRALDLASRVAGKRLVIVEEALKTHVAHWYEYDRAVCDIHRALGVETTVAAHTEISPDIRDSLPAEPVFTHTSWDHIYAHPDVWRRYVGIAHHNLRVYRTMNLFFSAYESFDCVFVPTVVIHHMIGWRALISRHMGRSFGRLVLLFRNNVGSYAPDSRLPTFKRNSVVWRHALRSFTPYVESGAVCLATDSERLATEYELVCGLRPVVFPSPRIAPPPKRSSGPGPATALGPYTFGCLGPARFEKGIGLLQAAMIRFLAANPAADVRFLIQWNQDVINPDGSIHRPDPALEADRRVVFLRDQIDSECYEQLLADIDCMVLPYQRESYFARISGVAVEAVTAGIPVIYTEDTWMEDLVRGVGAGLSIRSGDLDSLVDALSIAFAKREQLASEARARANMARNEHSAERFANLLWGLP